MDRSTVDRLVVEHLPIALRFAQRLTGDVQLAEEVVQETLCLVLRRWRSYRGDAAFGTWLLKIVVNVDRDRRRRTRDLLPLPAEDVASKSGGPVDHAIADELQTRLRAAIDRLPDRQREVALLSIGEGITTSEVAMILDISQANVHTSLHLARKRIAKTIGFDHANREPT